MSVSKKVDDRQKVRCTFIVFSQIRYVDKVGLPLLVLTVYCDASSFETMSHGFV